MSRVITIQAPESVDISYKDNLGGEHTLSAVELSCIYGDAIAEVTQEVEERKGKGAKASTAEQYSRFAKLLTDLLHRDKSATNGSNAPWITPETAYLIVDALSIVITDLKKNCSNGESSPSSLEVPPAQLTPASTPS